MQHSPDSKDGHIPIQTLSNPNKDKLKDNKVKDYTREYDSKNLLLTNDEEMAKPAAKKKETFFKSFGADVDEDS